MLSRTVKILSAKNWNLAPPEPKCESCHGFLLKNLVERGSYTEPIYKPPKDLIEQFEDIPGSSFFKNQVKYQMRF